MPDQIPIDPSAEIGTDSHEGIHEVLPDVGYQRLAIVNVAYVGAAGAGGGGWALVDAGIPGTTGQILHAVEHRFGRDARPSAIVMTHGHFDHVGVLRELAERWDVPVYAHELELPYLDGSASYPPPDPSVGGGLMARAASLYPRGPVDVRPWLRTLPADGAVPGMPGWRWLHTPGHTPGHVSLWRAADRTLIAGDAVITTKQESAYAVLTQKPELHGPPMYFTPDWPSARTSAERLAALEPEILVTGHGRAMHGPALREALHALARDFDEVAVPEQGRYVQPRT
jgi:glyoxylase-like metal-dependent hydrolase (beta-lactamase superfamily II)